LFNPREQLEPGQGGPPAAAVALSTAQLLREPFRLFPAADRLRRRIAGWKAAIERFCETVELAPDLAEEIGSARWFRGLATMLCLCLVALSFWPNFTSVEAATTQPANAAERDELRSAMIMPLAFGADSGRHMGASALVVPLAAAPERPRVEFATTLGAGDSFTGMLQRAGVAAGDAARLSQLVAASVPLGQIAPGTRFEVTLGPRAAPGQPRPLERLDFRARFDLDLAVARKGDALVVQRRPIAVDATPLRIEGTVGTSLYRSARAAGAPIKAIKQYLQALDQRVDLESDVAPGDRFDIIVAYKRSAEGGSQVGDLLYAGLEHDGRPRLQLLRWGPGGQLFDASGFGEQQTQQFAPVAGHITSGYGMRRHPILGYVRMHAGVDFGAAWGSPIHAVADGIVSFAGWHGGHGNYVRLEHGGGIGTGYGHMSRIAVSPGMMVHAGQVIGYVGSSGLSTGPHLHFEAYVNGHTVNPLSMSFTTRQAVGQGQMDAFKARLAALMKIPPGAALGSLAPRQAEVKAPAREIERLEE
jgi:murein DD-endopeptidase MepM/ murein hydrolase activator NlpD